MENGLPERKPLRMSHYDYNTPGAYFLTFCTHDRKHLLSRIVGAIHESPEPQLTACGKIVDTILQNIPEHLHVTIDRYVIMPNHVHLILFITSQDGRIISSPTDKKSISTVVGQFKRDVSKKIGIAVWQRSFHDHIIRGRDDYEKISKYMYNNPITWQYDCFYIAE